MSKEAFYLHLCEQFHGLIEDNYLLKTYVIPPGLVDDIRRAVEDDVPAYWLQDEAEDVGGASQAITYTTWEDRYPRLENGKPGHVYKAESNDVTLYCVADANGSGRFRPVDDLDKRAQKPINWRAAIDQAMTDIERDGSESALVQEFEDLGFSDVKIPVLENWQLSGAKPNHCYRGTCGEDVFYCQTDESGKGIFRHLPVSAFPGAVQAKKELSRIMGLWSGRPEGWQDFAEPKQRPINWRAVMEQAVTDIHQGGDKKAKRAMPWITDWLMAENEWDD